MASLVHRRVVLIAALLLVAACSDDGSTNGAIDSTEVTPAPVTTAPVTTSPYTTSPTSTGGPTTTASPSGSTVVEAGGWRVVVTQPQAGSTISRRPVICYVLTGSSREPVAAFDVTLQPLGATQGAHALVDVVVGAGAAVVDLTGVGEGQYDMRIQLVVDGTALEGAVVTLAGVTVSQGAAAPTCE